MIRLFTSRQLREARQHALDGGQALHVWTPPRSNGRSEWPGAPQCFQRSRTWAHLFDQDVERLRKTARRLGVRKVLIHHEGTPQQHVDLCGKPLDRAQEEAQPCQQTT